MHINPSTHVPLTTEIMDVLGIDFVEVDFDQPVFIVPDEHLAFVIPDSWDDVRLYEGKLAQEDDVDFEPFVTQWEKDAWLNAIDADDFESGPEPWIDTVQIYHDEFFEGHRLLYGDN